MDAQKTVWLEQLIQEFERTCGRNRELIEKGKDDPVVSKQAIQVLYLITEELQNFRKSRRFDELFEEVSKRILSAQQAVLRAAVQRHQIVRALLAAQLRDRN